MAQISRTLRYSAIAITAGLLLWVAFFWLPAACASPQTPAVPLGLATTTATPGDLSTTAIADQLSATFQAVSVALQPSVVSIKTVRSLEGSRQQRFGRSPFPDGLGEDFFDRFFPPQQPSQGFLQQGLGTGVIVSPDGHIVTNAHVIADADEVTVQLADDRELKAEVIGSDSKSDLAVIKIEAEDLHPAHLGDSDRLQVGQWVVAIGSPFGLRASMTAGIVSATGRSRVGLADYEDFIQTDAAINPGNSGGPLANLRGEVVGINTAILSRSGGNMGIGMAIPSNMVRSIMASLIEDGHVERGYLGVTIQDLSDELASSFNYDSNDGALVGDVNEDSPAQDAGLQQGDIIVQLDNKPVKNVDDLRLDIAASSPGTRVRLKVFRDGKTKTITVKLGSLPNSDEEVAGDSETGGQRLGLSVRTLDEETAQRLGYDVNPGGIVITAIEPLGAAARAGLQPREVILRVQGVDIGDAATFRREIRKHDLKKGIRLTVLRGDAERFVILKELG